jgi:hypothetical protein
VLIEWYDYRKEHYFEVHGVWDSKESALDKANEIGFKNMNKSPVKTKNNELRIKLGCSDEEEDVVFSVFEQSIPKS